MLSFLGLKVLKPINNRQKYRQALQQIKHYISLKSHLQIEESEYIILIASGQYHLTLVKNPLYLHTNYYNLPLLHQQDSQFLEVCYECLMIIRETFPTNIDLQIVSDSESKEIQIFQERKNQQFNRRVNSNLKAILQQKTELTAEDVEDIMYLCINHYSRKNKMLALRLLVNRVNQQNTIYISDQYLDYLQKLQDQNDLKKLVVELLYKIKNLQQKHSKNNQNIMKLSNIDQPKGQTLKLQPLIFQLRQSYNLERVCLLLVTVLKADNDKQYLSKLQPAISVITNRFLANEYDEITVYASEFADILKNYWIKRCKKWEQNLKTAVQTKVKQLSTNNATNRSHSNKSRLGLSQKILLS